MNFHRIFRNTLTLVLLGLACGLTACKKQPFAEVVEQTLYLGLPANVDTLASVNFEQLRQTDWFNDMLKQLETNPKSKDYKEQMDALRQQVGIDPWQDINRMIVANRGPEDPKKPGSAMIVLARGKFQNAPEKLKKLATYLGEDVLAEPKVNQVAHSSGIPKVQITGKLQRNVKQVVELNFAFPNDTMMVFSPSSQQINDTLDVIAGHVEGIQKDQNWLEMLKRPNIGAAVWATGPLSPDTTKKLAESLPEAADQIKGLKQAFLDLNFNPDLALRIGLVGENIDSATKLADKLRSKFDQLKGIGKFMLAAQQAVQTSKLLDNIKILNELETTRISVTLTADEQRLLRDEWEKLGQSMAQQGGGGPQLSLPGLPGLPGAGGSGLSIPGGAK